MPAMNHRAFLFVSAWTGWLKTSGARARSRLFFDPLAPRIWKSILVALCLFSATVATAPNYDKIMQFAEARYGSKGGQTLAAWREMLQTAQGMDETGKIKRVNEFFNRKLQFGEDQTVWGEKDYWASPLESMGRQIGDCEDFAIAKYVSLRILNVPNEKLRITYVKARIGGPRSDITQAHMILGYYPDPTGEPTILDNLITDLRPASRRSDLTPVFSFNSEGLWTGSGPSEKSSGSSTAKLSRWRDLVARMQEDGFEL